MYSTKFKETLPIPIKAGDKRLKINGVSPKVDCRVLSETLYQKMLNHTMNYECDGDPLTCIKDSCICKYNNIKNHSSLGDNNYKRAFAKYGKTHEIEKVMGTRVDITKLKDNQSVIWGDGETYHFRLTTHKPKK